MSGLGFLLGLLILISVDVMLGFIIFTFYELMVKHDVRKDESGAVIDLIKQKLINYNYDVYTTGESYTLNSVTYTVPINISLIAIKSPT